MLAGSLDKVRRTISKQPVNKLLLAGPIAIEANISLQDAEEALEELVYEGKLRRATPKELSRTSAILAFVRV